MSSSSKAGVAAGNRRFEEQVRRDAERMQGGLRYHSIELKHGQLLPGLMSIELLQRRLGIFDLPRNLSGRRVLDIGAWDGWFSFECERRGADVTAVDCVAMDVSRSQTPPRLKGGVSYSGRERVLRAPAGPV